MDCISGEAEVPCAVTMYTTAPYCYHIHGCSFNHLHVNVNDRANHGLPGPISDQLDSYRIPPSPEQPRWECPDVSVLFGSSQLKQLTGSLKDTAQIPDPHFAQICDESLYWNRNALSRSF